MAGWDNGETREAGGPAGPSRAQERTAWLLQTINDRKASEAFAALHYWVRAVRYEPTPGERELLERCEKRAALYSGAGELTGLLVAGAGAGTLRLPRPHAFAVSLTGALIGHMYANWKCNQPALVDLLTYGAQERTRGVESELADQAERILEVGGRQAVRVLHRQMTEAHRAAQEDAGAGRDGRRRGEANAGRRGVEGRGEAGGPASGSGFYGEGGAPALGEVLGLGGASEHGDGGGAGDDGGWGAGGEGRGRARPVSSWQDVRLRHQAGQQTATGLGDRGGGMAGGADEFFDVGMGGDDVHFTGEDEFGAVGNGLPPPAPVPQRALPLEARSHAAGLHGAGLHGGRRLPEAHSARLTRDSQFEDEAAAPEVVDDDVSPHRPNSWEAVRARSQQQADGPGAWRAVRETADAAASAGTLPGQEAPARRLKKNAYGDDSFD